MKKIHLLILVSLAVLLAGCVGANPYVDVPDEEGKVAGFWQGVWNGLTAPVTMIIGIFNKNLHLYDVNNTGLGYDWGFWIGVMIVGAVLALFGIVLRLK